ncbi:hypothetical protein CONCODRAFT_7084 [Conidiobolus coronatus NRRL 28638]|uniref:BTB domain-containing protein n=1 Tax=Conidiobolus coronatus (strain ATCC 28846 / CBS 209.66 / NRRL 28638) TaxID=796925 RepID=A0A137P5T9_CONC2|nr:hypothetical protein CONCODRAFT_7084 [Conidiobolus coronatus NRRL 28638]|eukprot:KXN70329.1 hypothetical protein CONCODRAFT_7084 [Conidiobolus coronatus NRRL 28638]
MCHSEYLIETSQFFKPMLDNEFIESKTNEISLTIEYNIMIILYQYFYLKQIDPKILKKENFSLCIDLYIKANEYQINLLKDVLKASICSNLDINNIDVLMRSKLLEQNDDLDGLLPKVIEFVLNKI